MKYAKRVILFGVDGAGTFFEQTPTPNMDRIFRNGAVCRRTLTEIPSISAQCWGSMLHGVPCGWHTLTNAMVSERPYPEDSPYPSVFRVVREAMPEAKLASFCDWDPINFGIIENGLDVYKYHAPDFALAEPAVRYIEENDFTLMYFHFDSVDGAGHRYGYGTPEHLAAITGNDALIGQIMDAVEKRGWLEDTLVLVEADHGGTPNYGYGGQHGGATEAEKYVSFFAAGPGVCPGQIEGMLVRDTPAVILQALGIAQPESWTACVPAGLFPDCVQSRPAGIPPAELTVSRDPLPEEGNFTEVFRDLEPLVYLPFEEENSGADVRGKLYRVAGIRGSAMGFQDGFLTMESPTLAQGYSLAFWVKPDPWISREGTVAAAVGSSCCQVDGQRGMAVEVGIDYVRFCQKGPKGNSPVLMDMTYAAPIGEKWSYIAVTVDKYRNQFGVSVDFGPIQYWNIPENMELLTGGRLCIGQDEAERFENRLRGAMDDFCIFGCALTDADLLRLKEYYQI